MLGQTWPPRGGGRWHGGKSEYLTTLAVYLNKMSMGQYVICMYVGQYVLNT
jgi:hypothetical protein